MSTRFHGASLSDPSFNMGPGGAAASAIARHVYRGMRNNGDDGDGGAAQRTNDHWVDTDIADDNVELVRLMLDESALARACVEHYQQIVAEKLSPFDARETQLVRALVQQLLLYGVAVLDDTALFAFDNDAKEDGSNNSEDDAPPVKRARRGGSVRAPPTLRVVPLEEHRVRVVVQYNAAQNAYRVRARWKYTGTTLAGPEMHDNASRRLLPVLVMRMPSTSPPALAIGPIAALEHHLELKKIALTAACMEYKTLTRPIIATVKSQQFDPEALRMGAHASAARANPGMLSDQAAAYRRMREAGANLQTHTALGNKQIEQLNLAADDRLHRLEMRHASMTLTASRAGAALAKRNGKNAQVQPEVIGASYNTLLSTHVETDITTPPDTRGYTNFADALQYHQRQLCMAFFLTPEEIAHGDASKSNAVGGGLLHATNARASTSISTDGVARQIIAVLSTLTDVLAMEGGGALPESDATVAEVRGRPIANLATLVPNLKPRWAPFSVALPMIEKALQMKEAGIITTDEARRMCRLEELVDDPRAAARTSRQLEEERAARAAAEINKLEAEGEAARVRNVHRL